MTKPSVTKTGQLYVRKLSEHFDTHNALDHDKDILFNMTHHIF